MTDRSHSTEEPDFHAFGITERTDRLFRDYTSIRPTPSNGPVFLGLLILSAAAAFCLAHLYFGLSIGLAFLLTPLMAFPFAFLLLFLFAYCAQVYFLNLHPERAVLRPYNVARHRWLAQTGKKKRGKRGNSA